MVGDSGVVEDSDGRTGDIRDLLYRDSFVPYPTTALFFNPLGLRSYSRLWDFTHWESVGDCW